MATDVEEKKEEAKTEFDKGFESVFNPVAEPATEEKPVVVSDEKPVEEVKETVVEEKPAEAKKEDAEPAKEEAPKSEPAKDTNVIDVDGNSATYEQRWKSQQGIVKAEMKKRADAEKLLAEKEAEIARLKAEFEKKPAEKSKADDAPDEVDALEEQYTDAVLLEDKALAAKIRKQIREIERKQIYESFRQETEHKVSSAIIQQSIEEKVSSIVKTTAEKYPFLDHTNDETANPYAIRLVRATRDDYVTQGMPFDEALEAAVAEIAPMFASKSLHKEPIVEAAEPAIDADKIQSTVAVKTSSAPVKTGGKPKGPQTFDEGFESVKPFG